MPTFTWRALKACIRPVVAARRFLSASRREDDGAVGGTEVAAVVVGAVGVDEVEALDELDELEDDDEAETLAEVLAVTNEPVELLLELLPELLPGLPFEARRDESAPPWKSPVVDAGREALPVDGGGSWPVLAGNCWSASEVSGFDVTSFGMADGFLLVEECPCRP
ncbi:hypothetical protein [Roseateles chitinivorans]|uniref:hypothetical protein n=1 Tax=Roseateles chitinivorans TaxID=2917965 RepID=UPI003D6678A2